jgi:hypothetical protein
VRPNRTFDPRPRAQGKRRLFCARAAAVIARANRWRALTEPVFPKRSGLHRHHGRPSHTTRKRCQQSQLREIWKVRGLAQGFEMIAKIWRFRRWSRRRDFWRSVWCSVAHGSARFAKNRRSDFLDERFSAGVPSLFQFLAFSANWAAVIFRPARRPRRVGVLF